MFKKVLTIAALAFSCSPGGQEQAPQSCVKTVVSADVKISGGVEKTFYWGYADIKYNPDLAGTVFSAQSEKLKLITDSNPLFRCRVIYIPNGEKLDAWTSRHCLMSIAIAEVNLYMFDDAGKKQKLDFDHSKFSGWPKVAQIIKSLDSVKSIHGAKFLDNFVAKNLFFNAFNSKIYDITEARVDNLRYNIYHNSTEDTLGHNSYFKKLFAQSLPEQTYLKRDLCATDFKQVNSGKASQHVCFSTTDLSLIQLKKPSTLTLPSFKKQYYSDWVAAQNNLEYAVTKFMVEEFTYSLSDFCKATSGDLESCDASTQLKGLISAGNDFKQFGTNSAELKRIQESVMKHSASPFAKDRLVNQYKHLQNLTKAFEQVSTIFAKLKTKYLKQDSVALAGIYTQKETKNSKLGLLIFDKVFKDSHATLTPRLDGFHFLTHSTKVTFEKQDSGSLLISSGFPLSTLSTVNGEASSGGSSSLGSVEVAQIDDVLDPSILGGSAENFAEISDDVQSPAGDSGVLVQKADPTSLDPVGNADPSTPQLEGKSQDSGSVATAPSPRSSNAQPYQGSETLGGGGC